MLKSITKFLNSKLVRRSLDAGAAGRRWTGGGAMANLNASMVAGGTAIRHRAAYQARNNPHAASAITSQVSNTIGTGIWPQASHPDSKQRRLLNSMFKKWSGQADISDRTDLGGLQAQIMRALVETGECFIRFHMNPNDRTMPLRLQLIAADQVDSTLHRDLDGGARIRAGVEFAADGRRIAYHIFPGRPNDVIGLNFTPVRVPATEMLHIFEPLEIGQVRGLSWLVPALPRLRDLDEYEDAQLLRQKLSAMYLGFITDPNGDAAGYDGTQADGLLQTGMEPGTLKILQPGNDIKFSDPAEVGDSATFIKGQLRAIAAGLGVTYEQMTGDLEGVNYSSIRAGLIEYRRKVDTFRWTVFIPQFCRPVWERFIHTSVLTGLIDAAAFDRDPASFLAAEWHPPSWDWVDPLKDIRAEREAVAAGFKPRSQVIREMGEDPEQVDAHRAEDAARSAALGLQEDPETLGPDTKQDEENDDERVLNA